ncbi:MAG: hypothetical protein JSU73_04860 [candidate division WOR-3 bacterium]|nr:MAG: hypothetical protein JSU73_04860 [candidate division WOR-3 bacterium]
MRKLLLALCLPALVLAIHDQQWFDVNNWLIPFINDGRFGFDPTIGTGEAGGSWPQPYRNKYVFGAGPWVGARLGPDTLVSMGYNPNSGGSEFTPVLVRYWRQGTGNPRDRIYTYPGDWPPSRTRFPMAPTEPTGEMTMWMCFCDSEPANHVEPGRPIGIDVYLTVFGWNRPRAEDIVFLEYDLVNPGDSDLDSVYFGPVFDPDIGAHGDDMYGLILDRLFSIEGDTIRVQNVAFAYDYDNYEIRNSRQQWDSGCPGAVALKLLSAPQGLGLSAVKKFTIDIDPTTDREQYLTMAGFDYRTGVYDPFDSIDLDPADKRFLMSSGPFTIPARSQVTACYALIASPFGAWQQPPEDRDTNDLALRCHWADSIYDRLLAVDETGPSPLARPLRALPGIALQGGVIRISGTTGPTCIYDLCGVLVRKLKGTDPAWDLRDLQGRTVRTGVYLVRDSSDRSCRVVVVSGR